MTSVDVKDHYPIGRVRPLRQLLTERTRSRGERLNWGEALNILAANTAGFMEGAGGINTRLGVEATPDEVRHLLRIMQASEGGRAHLVQMCGPVVSDAISRSLIALVMHEKTEGRYPPPDEEVPHG